MSNTLVLRTTPLTPVEIPRRWDTSIAARGVKLSTKSPLDMSSTSVLRTRPLTYANKVLLDSLDFEDDLEKLRTGDTSKKNTNDSSQEPMMSS